MKTKIYSLFAILTLSVTAWSQGVGINETGTNPNPSAILDVESTDKGFLPPRMTAAQRDAITSPATGLIVYNTDADCIQVNNGTPATPTWECLGVPATFDYSNVVGIVTTVTTATYTVQASDYLIIANNNGALSITWPALTASDAGRTVRVINDNIGGHAVTMFATPEFPFGSGINQLRGRDYVWTGSRWLAVTL